MTFETDVLVWAVVIHLIADWPLQTEWMALHKSNLLHPAAWVHSGIHALLLLLVFPWYFALGIGFTHLLIDTRVPVQWWSKTFKHMSPAEPNVRADRDVDGPGVPRDRFGCGGAVC